MKKVITYGTYDLLHGGHINLLRHAKELGDYLIVGVTTDKFDYERGKLNVRNNVMERIQAIQNTGLADQIIIEEYIGQKIDDIQKYAVDIFAIGDDWKGRFDYLNEYCKVVYLPRTKGVSSTLLREASQKQIRMGIIGTGSIAQRFVDEAKFVSGVSISSAYNPVGEEAKRFAKKNDIPYYSTQIEDITQYINACYIASPHLTHYEYAKYMLQQGKHVINETPFVLCEENAIELINIADTNNLVLMDALKTAYCPAFRHLITQLKSGIIGEIKDIEAALSTLTDSGRKLDLKQGGGSMSEDADFALLPILKLLGTHYSNVSFYTEFRNGVDIYTKCIMEYPNATASFKLGLGVKTEGNLIISGTKGYIYVPAPWWKTDYFEARFEDQNKNKKFFYTYEGEGLRYEIQEFATCVFYNKRNSHHITHEMTIAMARIHDIYRNKMNVVEINKN